jgi:hypothetical protein
MMTALASGAFLGISCGLAAYTGLRFQDSQPALASKVTAGFWTADGSRLRSASPPTIAQSPLRVLGLRSKVEPLPIGHRQQNDYGHVSK